MRDSTPREHHRSAGTEAAHRPARFQGGGCPRSGYPERVPRFWGFFWPHWYRFLRIADPVLRRWLRHRRLGNVVELTVAGRRSGLPRKVLLGLLGVDGRRYLGHPDVSCPWTLNLEASGEGLLHQPGSPQERVRARRLPPAEERERVIRATFRQHPFPGNVIYWLARDHIREVGVFYRLEPAQPAVTGRVET